MQTGQSVSGHRGEIGAYFSEDGDWEVEVEPVDPEKGKAALKGRQGGFLDFRLHRMWLS